MSMVLPPINDRLKQGAPGTWKYNLGDAVHGRVIIERLKFGTKAAMNLYLVYSPCCGKEITLQEQSLSRSARSAPDYPGLCTSCRNRQVAVGAMKRERASLVARVKPAMTEPDAEMRWAHALWQAPPMIANDPQSYLRYLENAR